MSPRKPPPSPPDNASSAPSSTLPAQFETFQFGELPQERPGLISMLVTSIKGSLASPSELQGTSHTRAPLPSSKVNSAPIPILITSFGSLEVPQVFELSPTGSIQTINRASNEDKLALGGSSSPTNSPMDGPRSFLGGRSGNFILRRLKNQDMDKSFWIRYEFRV